MTFDNLLIRARNIEKSYNSDQVLSDFNLDVWKGSIYGNTQLLDLAEYH